MEVDRPMDRLAIGLVGPNPSTSRHNNYILSVIDYFSRFLIAIPVRNKTAKCVATALHRYVFSVWGLCKELYSDQGGEFNNQLMASFCQEYGIRKIRTTAWRPSANGRIERAHRVIHAVLAKTVADDQKNWDVVLPAAVFALNATQHSSTGYSPYELMTGRKPFMSTDERLTAAGYDDKLQQRLSEMYAAPKRPDLLLTH
jgi:transposase InsO family protein